ncbi:MAG: AAA family ATPase [Gammaproteobacteria bacterium]
MVEIRKENSVEANLSSDNEYELLKEVWKEEMRQKIPIFIMGQVGVGKTEMIAECAKDLGRELIITHLARSSNTDFMIPTIENGIMKFAVNEKLMELVKGKKVWFLDEYDRADGATRNAILSLINERVFEGVKLPDDVAIVLAGNQETSRDTNVINQAEWSRCSVFRIDISNLNNNSDYLKYWINIAINKLNVDSRITSFISVYPDLLYRESEDNEQLATPRGWVNLSKALNVVDRINKKSVRYETITSFIGKMAGEKFLTYIEVYSKMPSAKEIMTNYEKCDINSLEKKLACSDILLNHIKVNTKDVSKVIELIHVNMKDELLYNFILMAKQHKDIADEIISLSKKDDKLRDTLSEISFIHVENNHLM